jgi:predicted Rossmann fold nucleotide-binding protein DprA/Smf involved in DNA uptake
MLAPYGPLAIYRGGGVKLSYEQRPDWPRLIRSDHVGPHTFHALLARYGSAGAALQALAGLARRRGAAVPTRICSRDAAVAEHDFPRRNRLISSLAAGVVVVEAAHRSGSLITARLAGEQGREVFAVPGSLLDPRAEVTTGLIKQSANPVTEAADMIAVLEPVLGRSPDLPAREEAAGPPVAPVLAPGDDERSRVLALLGPAPATIDDIVRLSQTTPATVRTVLLELEIAGQLERYGGG